MGERESQVKILCLFLTIPYLYHFPVAPVSQPSFSSSTRCFCSASAHRSLSSSTVKMGLSESGRLFTVIITLGILSFILGVVAENKKPASGTPIPGKDVVICKYPSDPTVTLGGLSIACLFLTTVFGVASVFYPYKKKSVPLDALQRNTALVVFFVIALLVSILAMSFFIWATTTESLHLKKNVHRNLKNDCPTAKTGLFGGAAFLALDSALFWLVCQMLTHNAREDYEEDDLKGGNYGQVLVSDYAPAGDAHARSV